MNILKYFKGYPEEVLNQIEGLVQSDKLKTYLITKYPAPHNISSDKLLFQYTNGLKQQYLKKAPQLSKVIYEKQKDIVQSALGNHTFISRNHGGKLKSKHEIRVSSTLKKAPMEMLEMLIVHELAHFKEKEHNKAFYNLCTYMQEDYHQVEFDLRLYLLLIDLGKDLY
ncbi:M48 family metallopeptidase [Halobacteriovorax sp.]|uniref:M48 metallopeptidase family protein n=1 Tax=Halobacteriovorax sp. TaxID=2020862 RepID=UPI003564EF89